jgi:hypothetical protein
MDQTIIYSPQSVVVSEIAVSLSGRNTEQLLFTSKEVTLQPGVTSLKLHCLVNLLSVVMSCLLTICRALLLARSY